MSFKTIIFDLGNVLVFFSHEKMFHQIGTLSGMTPEAVYTLLVEKKIGEQYEKGLIETQTLYEMVQKRGKNTFGIEAFLEAASNIFAPCEEMYPLLKTLKRKGYHLLLLSNTSEPHYNHIAKNYSLLHLFDHHILSYQVGIAKPERQIYELALEKGKAAPSECFFIDDRLENIEGGKLLGIKGHHFKTPALLIEDLLLQKILP